MKRVLTLIILAGLLAPTAYADFILQLTDGTSTVTIPDNAPADILGGLGQIHWIGSVGTFNLNVTTGLSKPFYPASPPSMDLNSINVTSRGAGTLTIRLTDTDFSFPGGPVTLESAWGGTTAGTVSLAQIYDPDNNLWGTGASATTLSSGPFGPGAFSDTRSVGVLGDPSFSLTEVVTIAHRSAGTTSFDAGSVVTPLPGAVVLGMFGLVVAGRKLRKMC